MSSYRRYVAEHGAAIYRAKRQVRKHALETGPDQAAATQQWAEDTFQDFARRLKDQPFVLEVQMPFRGASALFPEPYGICPDCGGPKMAPGLIHQCPADPVLAYRSKINGSIWCTTCPNPAVLRYSVPLTSDDLPNGGICRVCGVDVLIPVIPVVPNPHCFFCEHAPHGGEAGCHCGCRGTR